MQDRIARALREWHDNNAFKQPSSKRERCCAGAVTTIMLRLFQKLLTDKELTPPDDWDPPIGYSRNTWGNIAHIKVCSASIFPPKTFAVIRAHHASSICFIAEPVSAETHAVLHESICIPVEPRKVHIIVHRSALAAHMPSAGSLYFFFSGGPFLDYAPRLLV